METQLPKTTYYKDDDFILELQWHEGQIFLHCEVSNWKLSSLKRMYSVFKSLLTEVKNLEVDRLITITPNPKFAKLFGGTVISDFEYENTNYEVIIWEWTQ